MSIAIVSKHKSIYGWHTDQLKISAKKSGYPIQFVNYSNLNNNSQYYLKELEKYSTIFWRSSDLKKNIERDVLFKLLKNKTFVNRGILLVPSTAEKFYQQKYLESTKYPLAVKTIPSFSFKSVDELYTAIDSNELVFPLIAKPNTGSKGIGLMLIENKKHLEDLREKIKDHVVQEFIPNKCDYRVFVLGGIPKYAMKRSRQKDKSFVNNISQGGKAEIIENSRLRDRLFDIAAEVASVFDLGICGVDIIENSETGELFFMEVNTAPQWKGLQSACNVNISQLIVDYLITMDQRHQSKSIYSLVEEYYDKNIHLTSKSFHYYSRLYLWNKDAKYYDLLMKQHYNRYQNIEKSIDNRLNMIESNSLRQIDVRKEFLERYPLIRNYNSLLFYYMFAKTIYEINISKQIFDRDLIDKFIDMANELLLDEEAIAKLSTIAINFLYGVKTLVSEFPDKNFDFDPTIITSIAKRSLHSKKENDLLVYMLTHAIIGESIFYSKKIESKKLPMYIDMIKILEDVISKAFFNISLDNKFEFLVCCKICNYKSSLSDVILSEAENSLSSVGNYLVDCHNTSIEENKRSFSVSEHRNVLFLMAF